MTNVTLPIRKRRVKKTVSWSTQLTMMWTIPSRRDHLCDFEVLCQPRSLPEEYPFMEADDGLCYCRKCKHFLECEPSDLQSDMDGPIPFVPDI